MSLVLNAIDAMPGGGQLTLRTWSDAKEVYCAVSDTGSGMSDEVRQRAFEPFFTTKQSGQGTGLGLSQVYGFVKQSGGHVKIYSEVGEGTTVKIYLRRFVGTPSALQDVRGEPARGRSGECILVVEDDADVRAYVVETLGGLGYDVLEAGGGEDALRLLDEHKTIGLLLTDVVMPGMNGRKLAEEARERRPALKVLFMTGYSRNAIVHQGRLDAGVELIQKPLDSGQLATTVRRILDS
jgi:CheY-like chemotaxis protein